MFLNFEAKADQDYGNKSAYKDQLILRLKQAAQLAQEESATHLRARNDLVQKVQTLTYSLRLKENELKGNF